MATIAGTAAPALNAPSASRQVIEEAILGLMAGDKSAVEESFHQAFKNGLLEQLIPGISRLNGCRQNADAHKEGDALVHTGKVFAEVSAGCRESSPGDRYVQGLAAIVHDLEKPSTLAEKNGKITNFGHAEAAVKRIDEIAPAFHLSSEEVNQLKFLVGQHMTAHTLLTMGEKKRLEVYNSPYFSALCLLQEADARSCWNSPDGSKHAPVHRDAFVQDRNALLSREAEKGLQTRLTIAVNDTLKELGVEPGPYLGQVKKALVTAITKGDVLTEQQAKKWAQTYYEAHRP